MISSAMNDIILKLFDYASQGLPCLLDNLAALMGSQRLSLVDEPDSQEAANDIIQVSELDWQPPPSSDVSPMLDICADNSCALMLQLDMNRSTDSRQPMLLICHYDSSHSAQTALNRPELQGLIPHIQQALFIAREISEQIGDIQALQYVIQHHPLKALFSFKSPGPLFLTSAHPTMLPAANQNFELCISKQSLSHHFNLSPSEIELAQALFSGMSLNDITEERHVSKQTVRKQLQSILKKTSAQSQEALMLLMFDRCVLTSLDTPEPPPTIGKLGPTAKR